MSHRGMKFTNQYLVSLSLAKSKFLSNLDDFWSAACHAVSCRGSLVNVVQSRLKQNP